MDTIFTDTHPYQATITGEFTYFTQGQRVGGVPFRLTIADNCCEEHAEIAARNMIRAESARRNAEESSYGITVHPRFTT